MKTSVWILLCCIASLMVAVGLVSTGGCKLQSVASSQADDHWVFVAPPDDLPVIHITGAYQSMNVGGSTNYTISVQANGKVSSSGGIDRLMPLRALSEKHVATMVTYLHRRGCLDLSQEDLDRAIQKVQHPPRGLRMVTSTSGKRRLVVRYGTNAWVITHKDLNQYASPPFDKNPVISAINDGISFIDKAICE